MTNDKQKVDFPDSGENVFETKGARPGKGRLVELIKNVPRNTKAFYDQFADYLLANNVLVLPCKVGQTVYKVVNDKRVKKPYECKVVGIWYAEDEIANDVHLVRYVNGIFDCSFSVQFKDFGKTVFLTKEEAVAKLKEGVQG